MRGIRQCTAPESIVPRLRLLLRPAGTNYFSSPSRELRNWGQQAKPAKLESSVKPEHSPDSCRRPFTASPHCPLLFAHGSQMPLPIKGLPSPQAGYFLLLHIYNHTPLCTKRPFSPRPPGIPTYSWKERSPAKNASTSQRKGLWR